MANDLNTILHGLKFPAPKSVAGRASIADLFPNRRKRTGIYVLHFADGACYVGQAVDVVRRYAQHRHTHTDITYITFKSTGKKALNTEEKQTIKALEQAGFNLRNIQLVTFSYAETDFDLLMPPDEQTKWRNDPSYYGPDQVERVDDPHVCSSNADKFAKFQQQPYADDVIAVLRKYVQTCVPVPRKSEVSFWMVSCLPYPNVFARINLGWQTSFDAFTYQNQINYQWYLTRNLAEEVFEVELDTITEEYGVFLHPSPESPELRVEIFQSPLTKGGTDQVFVSVVGKENALLLMQDEYMVKAVRRFNLGLLQKGPCPWAKSHCFDLADRLLKGVSR